MRTSWLSITIPLALALNHPPLQAERPLVQIFTVRDGLPRNDINSLMSDSRGFLWFCTPEGLSQFDGTTFRNFGVADGLPDRDVRLMLQARDGAYWLGTAQGLCRFRPNAGRTRGLPMFETLRPPGPDGSQYIDALAEDPRTGAILCGTNAGLYRYETDPPSGRFVAVPLGVQSTSLEIFALVTAADGALWAGAINGLYHRSVSGEVWHFGIESGLPGSEVLSLLTDANGRLWVGTLHGLCLLVLAPNRSGRIVERVFTTKDGLASDQINDLWLNRGKLIAATGRGLGFAIQKDGAVTGFRSYAIEQGVPPPNSIAEDSDGNLWTGTPRGAVRFPDQSFFLAYDKRDGLAGEAVVSFARGPDGTLFAISRSARADYINQFSGGRFRSVLPSLWQSNVTPGWGWSQTSFCDHLGEWWIATSRGLYRYAAVADIAQLAHTEPKAVYTRHDGLPGDQVFRLFEDSRGDIWMGFTDTAATPLARWTRATNSIVTFGAGEGLPRTNPPTSFAEDRSGNVWIGFYWHDLVRFRAGRFTLFDSGSGFPNGSVMSLLFSASGALWAGSTRGGLVKIGDLNADRPRFSAYTMREGMSSNEIRSITEDTAGRIYAITGRGIDRLDPATGLISFLPVDVNNNAGRDRKGALWFGTESGLVMLKATAAAPAAEPPIRISGIRVLGVAQPVSELGESHIAGAQLSHAQDQVEIDFASIHFDPAEQVQFQYKLEGADHDWNPPTSVRTVNYARLAPGSYRFLVRARNSRGKFSPSPATFSFQISPPVWLRWWFEAAAAALLSALVYAAYRYRVQRLLELERVRTRIATDLHDDIGSALSQIAILAEVERQQSGESSGRLRRLAELSRELVASMSEIVWATDPRKDHLRDLTRRMRGFAIELFENRDVQLDLELPETSVDIPLTADVRRQLFLIFKESLHNIQRHSGCRYVRVELRCSRDKLRLRVEDDGHGFDTSAEDPEGGNGLRSMRARAESIGGQCCIISRPGEGTVVEFSTTLRARIHAR